MSDLFWTEGTIEAIELDVKGKRIRFRLIPSAGFLVEGSSLSQVLFTEEEQIPIEPIPSFSSDAKLVVCNKKQEKKVALWFFVNGKRNRSIRGLAGFGDCIAGLLLKAKNSRCNVRVGILKREIPARIREKDDIPTKDEFELSKLMFI